MEFVDDLDAVQEEVVPEEKDKVLEDAVLFETGLQTAYIGLGACGNKIVNCFWQRGFRHTFIINSTADDFEGLEICKESNGENCLDLKQGGFGKDLDKSRAFFSKVAVKEQVRLMLREYITPDRQLVMLAVGLGGGTGAGAFPVIYQLCKEIIAEQGSSAEVGAIVCIPGASAGTPSSISAIKALTDIVKLQLKPLLIVDNDSFIKRNKHLAYNSAMPTLNNEIAGLFVNLLRFSKMASSDVFDASDLQRVFGAGLCTIGKASVPNWNKDKSVIENAVLSCYTNSCLSAIDVATATQAAAIIYAGENVLNQFSVLELLAGNELLRKAANENIMLHSGIYQAKDPNALTVFTVIGGGKLSEDTYKRMSQSSGVPTNKLFELFQ